MSEDLESVQRSEPGTYSLLVLTEDGRNINTVVRVGSWGPTEPAAVSVDKVLLEHTRVFPTCCPWLFLRAEELRETTWPVKPEMLTTWPCLLIPFQD